MRLDCKHVIHARSRCCLETNITRCPFHPRTSFLYLSTMRYQLSFITIYPCKWTKNIGPIYWKSRDHWNPLQPYASGFSLNGRFKLAVTHSILTCSWLHNLHDFPLLFVIVFLTIPLQDVVAREIPQPGAIEAESSWTLGASNDRPPGEIQRQHRLQLVHRAAAIVATENITQDGHLKIVRKTGSWKNKTQHAMGCDSIHIDVDDGQLAV